MRGGRGDGRRHQREGERGEGQDQSSHGAGDATGDGA
jgi:hypothetical protein